MFGLLDLKSELYWLTCVRVCFTEYDKTFWMSSYDGFWMLMFLLSTSISRFLCSIGVYFLYLPAISLYALSKISIYMRPSATPLTATTIDCRFEFILSRKLISPYLLTLIKFYYLLYFAFPTKLNLILINKLNNKELIQCCYWFTAQKVYEDENV